MIVDEAQDIGVAQLRFLAALGTNGLFFAGDLGNASSKRYYRRPLALRSAGDLRY